MSRPRLPYRLLSSARGSRPLSIDFPITPLTWVWLPCHTCTSFTHAHISSTHTLTHCNVLICPGCHLWAFSLSIVCFLVITPASFLDPVILCWLPRLGLFLPGLWYLPPALTTLPVSLTTSLLCPLCSYCWWLTRSWPFDHSNKAANGSRSVWCFVTIRKKERKKERKNKIKNKLFTFSCINLISFKYLGLSFGKFIQNVLGV